MKLRYIKLIVLLIIVIVGCHNSIYNNALVVPYSSPEITYSGRIDSLHKKHVDIYWSGSSIKLNFEGAAIAVQMKDETAKNYYNVILDNDSIIIFKPDTMLQYHQLFSDLKKGAHSIEIFKRTEWGNGKTSFYGFRIEGDAKLLEKPEIKKRKIEFYGNSITAGYGNEDYEADRSDSIFTNNYNSYAAITARHFNAEYSCIAKGGIGLMLSWFNFTMPQLYDRFAPNDDSRIWDFEKYKPQIVVINLFQNDSWLVKKPERKEFYAKFGTTPPNRVYIIKAYKDFIGKIRSKYPDADIICALGSMDATKEGSLWPAYIESAVKELNDKKMHTLFFPYKKTPGHPKVNEHEVMAKQLIEFIEKEIPW